MTRLTAPWLNGPAQTVCAMLTDAGHQAWFVGGCVRNALINAPVSDLDLSTDARPNRVMDLAQSAGLKAVPTGIDHGTVTVIANGIPFEITTFRRDVATDGRRAVVAFADTMLEDAGRRDFTMNALYCDALGEISDPLNGLPDLYKRHVRFINDADQRIKEDYLRILRFFRFHAWYGDPAGGIDADGLAACAANLDGLSGLSKERITSELLKLLTAPDPAPALASMAAAGVLGQILPGATSQIIAVLVHVEQQAGLSPDPIRRLVAMGGMRDGLRLTTKHEKLITQLSGTQSLATLAYNHGANIALDRAAIEAASLGQQLDPATIQLTQFAASQTFPLKAADLMPALQGAALGTALKNAQDDWIASGFKLTKQDLLG
ncbi:CCA tRNA nucleotidyltransferase [Yoonia sp. MH D7]